VLIVNVSKYTEKYAVLSDDGKKVNKEIEKLLVNIQENIVAANEKVLVDFSGINVVAASFLSHAVGALYRKFPHEFIDNHLEFKWQEGREYNNNTLMLVVENAKHWANKGRER